MVWRSILNRRCGGGKTRTQSNYEVILAETKIARCAIQRRLMTVTLSLSLWWGFCSLSSNGTATDLIVFSEATQKLLGDKFLFGGFESFLAVSAILELTGAYAGMNPFTGSEF